jgi:hypothetical protein
MCNSLATVRLDVLPSDTSDRSGRTTYFICGPKRFTENMQSALSNQDVHESRIITESFAQTASVTIGSGWSIRTLTYSLTAGAMLLATGFIMALDLSRSVPRLAGAQITGTAAHAAATANNTASANSAKNSGVQTPAAAQSTTQPSYTNYQTPVSSVS